MLLHQPGRAAEYAWKQADNRVSQPFAYCEYNKVPGIHQQSLIGLIGGGLNIFELRHIRE